ncbi:MULTISPECIES: hypothetical protein [Rhodanobacter]|jgi:hypothetical protein|uniref:Transmembrane protein n=2 Tax=Rhodanobacter TaxID=75309 RepID=I4W2W4_9GAMM|nr:MULTISPECIES: hypothetical protein [Rhodanobacter]EIL93805.1 hypothetical protein UU7_06763 [Rhodanobacter spathiphylli B39]KQZ68203.1 hypothetical protein ASD55_16825 [Rhodanobacter sp. Root561]KRB38226.1 hypothetical protein ASD82_11685 [Rhodanobacter sp. Root179]
MRTVLFRLIGVLEIAGGFYGVAAMLHRLLPFGAHDSLIALLGLALYGFVLAAGIQLVAGSEQGVRMSRWAQLLQLPLIALPVFSYGLHCGAFVNVFATLQSTPRLGIDWHLGSQGFLLAIAGPSVSRIGINLLALLSWLVLRLR